MAKPAGEGTRSVTALIGGFDALVVSLGSIALLVAGTSLSWWLDAGATGVRIKSEVPLSEMFGYIGDLRTMTSGRGQFSMEFSHYSPCPKNVADAVIKEVNDRNAAK